MNNKTMAQVESMNYLRIIIDKKFLFNQYIDYIADKATKNDLSKSTKINWGLRTDVLRMIYKAAALPMELHGVPVWILSLTRNKCSKTEKSTTPNESRHTRQCYTRHYAF